MPPRGPRRGGTRRHGEADDQGEREEPRDPEARARLVCYRLLTIAPRTRAQLAQALRRRGIPDDVAAAVLDQLTGAGLIDDAAFARAWVESRHHARGLSRRSLSAELHQRGVAADEIEEAIETLDADKETDTARRLVERKLAASRGQPADARMRRVAGMLARKGYPAGLVFRLIRETLQQEGADVPDEFADAELPVVRFGRFALMLCCLILIWA